MKIIHVIIGLEPVGGAERMLGRLVEFQLNKSGCEHIVISLSTLGDFGEKIQRKGIQVLHFNAKNSISLFFTTFKIINIFKSEKPDIVQTWMYHADLIGGLAAKIAGIKCILWGVRATKINIGNNRSTLYVQKLCAMLSPYIPSKIVCVAEASKQAHIIAGYDQNKMLVINNGFDIERFIFSKKSKEQIRIKLDLMNKFVVGSVGRLNLDKNHDLLLSVAEVTVKKIPNIMFLLVGRDVNDAKSKFYRKIEEKGLLRYFLLIGEVENTAEYYQSMDVYCLHSDTEGFPNVLGEAMASGLPCISTDAGDARKLLDDDSMVVDCGDVDGITQRILMLEQLSTSEREQLGDINRKKIKDNYSLDEISRKFTNLYEQSAYLGE